MARAKKRTDGRYCKNVTIGRNEDGSLKRKMIYANTQKELELKVAELTLQVDRGVIVDDKNMTIGIWSDKWFETYKGNFEPSTKHQYACMIRKYIKPNFGDTRLKDLKQVQIKKVLNEIENNGLISMPKRYISTMIQILDSAVENNYILKNVAKGLTAKRQYPKSKEPLTNDEINIIKNTPHEVQNICLTLIYSGLRIGELMALTWADVDFKNRLININKSAETIKGVTIEKQPKTENSNRDVPIVQPLYELLQQLDNNRIKNIDKTKDYVFNRKGKMYSKNVIAKLRVLYCKLCGFNFTYHQCRHTCASMLYYANIGIKEAQEWLGHGSSKVTMDIYTHLQEKDKKTSTNKIDEYLKTI